MSGTGSYRCGTAARWLPRLLAASVLVAGWLMMLRVEPEAATPMVRSLRGLSVVFGAALALWIVRKGGEVRWRYELGDDALRVLHPGGSADLEYDWIQSARYEAPFGESRGWLPATVLQDKHGRTWRISALIDDGPKLIAELVQRREELNAWVEAHRIEERMARAALRVRIGYGLAFAILLAATIYAVR